MFSSRSPSNTSTQLLSSLPSLRPSTVSVLPNSATAWSAIARLSIRNSCSGCLRRVGLCSAAPVRLRVSNGQRRGVRSIGEAGGAPEVLLGLRRRRGSVGGAGERPAQALERRRRALPRQPRSLGAAPGQVVVQRLPLGEHVARID